MDYIPWHSPIRTKQDRGLKGNGHCVYSTYPCEYRKSYLEEQAGYWECTVSIRTNLMQANRQIQLNCEVRTVYHSYVRWYVSV